MMGRYRQRPMQTTHPLTTFQQNFLTQWRRMNPTNARPNDRLVDTSKKRLSCGPCGMDARHQYWPLFRMHENTPGQKM